MPEQESRVTSKDGTTIAYDRQGSGPAVILVGGGLVDRSENAPLAAELAESFTVYNYDRRGRGESGDTQPYALEREIEDIEALLAEAGGSAPLYGVSSGGALVIEAAAAGLAIEKIGMYEVPYMTSEEMSRRWRDYVDELDAALAEDRRDVAAELFLRLVGTPDEGVAGVKSSPHWPGMKAIAHTLAYDAACLGDGEPPVERLEKLTQPALVATGGADPEDSHMPAMAPDFFNRAGDAIAASVPEAERLTLDGQGHMADPKLMAPVLERFFAK
jgi:pimeloyl-ACP methyl ester carboxylesterase